MLHDAHVFAMYDAWEPCQDEEAPLETYLDAGYVAQTEREYWEEFYGYESAF